MCVKFSIYNQIVIVNSTQTTDSRSKVLILVYLKEMESHQRAKEHAIISQEVDLDERI